MGKKIENLKKLQRNKFNIFNYEEIKDYNKLLDYSNNHELFTIRFDRDKDFKSLPFYIFDNTIENKEEYFNTIIEEMNKLNCTLLVSNGLIYDKDLRFNFVCELDKNLNFILELCDKKVPLRKMYNYKTTVIKGNIMEDRYTYINKKENKFHSEDIKNILLWILDKKDKYNYFECTYYNIKVGINNDYIITWQTN